MVKTSLLDFTAIYEVIESIKTLGFYRFNKIFKWSFASIVLTKNEKQVKAINPYRGEIWRVNFGENVGSEINKIRPCLIVSNWKGNKYGTTIMGVALTSREPRLSTHVQLDENSIIYSQENLHGIFVCEQLRTLSKSRFIEKIGKVNPEFMKSINSALSIALELDNLEN